MLALTREKFLGHLQEIPHLIFLYQKGADNFVKETIVWLEQTEESLLQLRNPLASFVASERGKIAAVHDGYIAPDVEITSRTKRKAQSVSALLAICRVEAAMQKTINQIDTQFNVWREKMAQFIAVATTYESIPFPPEEPRNAWIISVWKNFTITDETRGMYNYLNTAMCQSDRVYLLNDLLENLINN